MAAAIRAHASVIVTFNAAHFPSEAINAYGLHTRHPDEFLVDLFSLDEAEFINCLQWDFRHYRAPPLSLDAYAASLKAAGVPRAAELTLKLRVLLEDGDGA